MPSHTVEAVAQISNPPEDVIAYVANAQNRTLYLAPLTSISNVQGESTEVGSSWSWCWSMLGIDFEGVGTCTQYEAGKCYAFKTEGGIESTFTYRVEADGNGSTLTITVDFETPAAVLALPGGEGLLEKLEQSEAETTVQNLKSILDQ
ncbi:MAG: hypothetical protein CMJ59_19530 [Planctomycetaceae bacterium]|nr:hypothetical protein [Planctomycetaceae bacterium]